jgi:hypothetical protein
MLLFLWHLKSTFRAQFIFRNYARLVEIVLLYCLHCILVVHIQLVNIVVFLATQSRALVEGYLSEQLVLVAWMGVNGCEPFSIFTL